MKNNFKMHAIFCGFMVWALNTFKDIDEVQQEKMMGFVLENMKTLLLNGEDFSTNDLINYIFNLIETEQV